MSLTHPPTTPMRDRPGLPKPDPDNVEALADAVNRFHAKLHASLGDELIADVTRQFAYRTFDRASVCVHFTAGSDA